MKHEYISSACLIKKFKNIKLPKHLQRIFNVMASGWGSEGRGSYPSTFGILSPCVAKKFSKKNYSRPG